MIVTQELRAAFGFRPHDTLVLDAFKSNQRFADLLRASLCDDVLSRLDLDSLKELPTTYFTRSGKKRVLDLVCSVNIDAVGDAEPRELIIFVEHKSSNDAASVRQLGMYKSVLRRDRPDALHLAMIVFHGPSKQWTQELEYCESVESVPPEIMREIGGEISGRFEYRLLNLHDPAVRRRTKELDSAVVFDVLRSIWNLTEEDVERLLIKAQEQPHPLREQLMRAVARYIMTVYPEYTWNRLREIEARVIPMKEDRVMAELMESDKQIIEFGRKEGLKLGRKLAKQQIAQNMLRRGIDDHLVVEYTEMSAESVAKLKQELNGA